MKVVIDTSVLMYLITPTANAPLDPSTGKPVAHCQDRIEGLLERLDVAKVQLLIPAPVLSELLIKADGRQAEVLAVLANKRSVLIAPFDVAAAVENAALRRPKAKGNKDEPGTKHEVSFDLQILAVARVAGAKIILSDDVRLRKRAEQAGMEVLGIADLPVPDSRRQIPMPFGDAPPVEDTETGTADDVSEDE